MRLSDHECKDANELNSKWILVYPKSVHLFSSRFEFDYLSDGYLKRVFAFVFVKFIEY